MNIIRAQGGLGNQIFQYAACKFLELVSRQETKLDIAHLDRFRPPRVFSLNGLFVDALGCIACEDDWPNLGIRDRMLAKYVRNPRLLKLAGSEHIHFDTDALQTTLPSTPGYWTGYWQSQSFVNPVIDALREKILYYSDSERKLLEGELGQLGVATVALHVRRGDYVTDKRASRYHGALDKSYYEAAVREIKLRVGPVRVLVFSDDMAWARKHLNDLPAELSFVSMSGPDRDVRELKLMMETAHHVISNSTFSWWAARLARNPDNIKIAPRKWFVSDRATRPDLFQGDWIHL